MTHAMEGFARLCDDGWLQGWHERNGGNLSYRMSAEDVAAGMDALICAAEEWADQNGTECPVFVIVASPVMDGSITDTAGGSPEITEYIQKPAVLPGPN